MSDAPRVGYRGYVTCRPFGGLHIPVPVQALVMRDYCARNGFMYKLHVNENIFPHSYVVLDGVINELKSYEGLLATSIFMMPKRQERRLDIYRRILDQDASLHFVLEDLVIRTPEDIDPVEEILSIHFVLPEAPKTVSDADAVPVLD